MKLKSGNTIHQRVDPIVGISFSKLVVQRIAFNHPWLKANFLLLSKAVGAIEDDKNDPKLVELQEKGNKFIDKFEKN